MTNLQKYLSEDFWVTLISKVGVALIQIAIVFIIYLIVKSIGTKVIERSFERYKEKREVSSGRVITLERLLLNIFSYVLFFIFIVIIFQTFGLKTSSLLAGAGVVGLAVGFGAQGLVSDIVTGFFILLEQQIDVGDYVTIGNLDGIVEEVGLRTTHLRSFDGTVHFIPNRGISTVSNHSRGNMRALVDISIAYDENIDEAIKVIQDTCDKVAEGNEMIIEGPSVLGVQTIGSSDVVLRIIAQTRNGEQWEVERILKKAIKEAFDENGIEIPYPHQVYVHKNDINNARSTQ
ncbi:mechanosensitive ion channel family protein [Pullulanibacillus sp. KACC 23026]|uniref:mechanosensitive ion channel family protein n=1 Tax=Pullulanibacillus sp. KACC 23026 TaxID=3028315 RepID=UPI0023AF5A5B|nr:mechanosensitive ion channel family protein [Pullulanibacillus sp. KACC 23026]WEG11769.1 mechanosensitive ion channel family protein [Pullulanibacillus sp. KACC 23026]